MRSLRSARIWRRAGLAFVFVWFLLGGMGHFVFTPSYVSVVPDYVPFPLAVVLATGAFEIAAAFALLAARLRRPVGLALIAFTISVTPVHIEMLRHAERYPELGPFVLWARLLFQPVFVWVATQPRGAMRIKSRPREGGSNRGTFEGWSE